MSRVWRVSTWDAEQGSAPDEEVVANAVEVIEELFAWAATVAEERSDQLNALKDALEDLCAGEEALASLARQVYLRQEALSGRIQALARQDMENLIGNMLHQVARQRELSIDEKIRLLHSIPGPQADRQSCLHAPRRLGTATVTPHIAGTGIDNGA